MTAHYSTASGGGAVTQLNALAALANGGTLKIYSDAAPKDPDSAFTGTLLATLTFSTTAFGAASVSGAFPSKTVTVSANSITSGTAAAGTAASFGLFTSGGTLFATGSVGTSGADLNLNSTAFSAGATVSVSAFQLTLAA